MLDIVLAAVELLLQTYYYFTAPDTQVAFVFIPLSYVVHPGDASRWGHLTDADPVRDSSHIDGEIRALQERGIPIVQAVTAADAAAGGAPKALGSAEP